MKWQNLGGGWYETADAEWKVKRLSAKEWGVFQYGVFLCDCPTKDSAMGFVAEIARGM
mgnify:CR=1 FL=1